MFFCPRCLLNRYGEEVEKVNQLAQWKCPKCRDICNCSNCRKKRGLEATGILANMSKAAGFTSVSDLLQKNPNAKRPPSASLQAPGAKAPKQAAGEAKPKAQKKKEPKPEAAPDLIDDELLGARPHSMPEREAVRMHRVSDEVSDMRWPPDLAHTVDLPPDCSAGDLAEVLEFLKVFGEQTGTAGISLSFAAVELLQPATEAGHSAYTREERSVAGHVHMRLLDLVRSDWGIRDSVGIHGWQPVMAQYLRQDRLHGLAALDRLSGASSAGCAAAAAAQLPNDHEVDAAVASPGAVAAAVGGDQESEGEDSLLMFPAGGYWALQPGTRLRMLRSLCFDALETRAIRQCMEDAMGAAAEEDKGRREELAAAKREAREAWQKQRDKQIALLLASGSGSGLTIEEQRSLMDRSWAKVDAEAAATAAPQLPGSGAAMAFPAAVRILPLGRDRSGALFWKLACCPVLAGSADAAVLMASEFRAADSDEWSVISDAATLAKSLDGRGRREAGLLRALEAGYDLGATKSGPAAGGVKSGAPPAAAAKIGNGKNVAAATTGTVDTAGTGKAAAGKAGAGKKAAAKAGAAESLAATKPAAMATKEAASVSAGQIGAADVAPAKAGAQKAKVTPAEKASQDAAAAKAKPGRKRAAAVLTAKPENGAAGAAQTAAAEPAEDAGNCDNAAAKAKPMKRQRKGAAENAAGPGKRLTRSQAAA
ncbi:hypothetical protein COCSUDRAFT_59460 [Coccomyxa subellipsoidea C-169]|uniref:Zinc-finger domain-containing protein n=1 Tax=Coccomyxa subellipsoidea (strain C-169) TaxID=574566 RepID=I0Z8J9_COCSC|nr:hypothetical protein COCSUDRAFT_59460 [Coccomyxa subellipsoidea C-169]EIE26968.1 hypothetical protein COCSUDRAFT_59460 [Coccomyxa subellipsoidea C-169]|eukprot:XP_005651512.1 hypothetical protein COCSUDRAFT_59460 [Coccomyxa subellipsoidea C-169]